MTLPRLLDEHSREHEQTETQTLSASPQASTSGARGGLAAATSQLLRARETVLKVLHAHEAKPARRRARKDRENSGAAAAPTMGACDACRKVTRSAARCYIAEVGCSRCGRLCAQMKMKCDGVAGEADCTRCRTVRVSRALPTLRREQS